MIRSTPSLCIAALSCGPRSSHQLTPFFACFLQDEDADAITLDKSDLPPEMTVTEEEEEAAGGRVRGSVAVPIFNAGVMGELNKALGARMQRKSSLKEEEKKEDEPAKAEAKPDMTIEQPKVPLVPLKPVK